MMLLLILKYAKSLKIDMCNLLLCLHAELFILALTNAIADNGVSRLKNDFIEFRITTDYYQMYLQ